MDTRTGDITKRGLLLDYERTLMGKTQTKNVQKNYFRSESPERNEELALYLMRYAVENILQWTPEEAASNLSAAAIKALSIYYPYRKVRLPREVARDRDTFYVAALLYPQLKVFSEENLVLIVYRSVLENVAGKFPKDYFLEAGGTERACICLRYMLKYRVSFVDMEEMYRMFADSPKADQLLQKYGLLTARKTLYRTPLDYLYDALTEIQKSELLKKFCRFRSLYASSKPQKKISSCMLKAEGKGPGADPFATNYRSFVQKYRGSEAQKKVRESLVYRKEEKAGNPGWGIPPGGRPQ